jgi:hypothetical protein
MSGNIVSFSNTKKYSCKEYYLKRNEIPRGLCLVYIYIHYQCTLYTKF